MARPARLQQFFIPRRGGGSGGAPFVPSAEPMAPGAYRPPVDRVLSEEGPPPGAPYDGPPAGGWRWHLLPGETVRTYYQSWTREAGACGHTHTTEALGWACAQRLQRDLHHVTAFTLDGQTSTRTRFVASPRRTRR